jgi:SAM-dependent methyltransferase
VTRAAHPANNHLAQQALARAIHAGTIFSGAFLLFLVQPIVSKHILPWFGGSAAVWATCLVFFQTLLLLGYAYSDVISRHLAPRAQVMLHALLLVASAACLPVLAGDAWKPVGDEDPGRHILLLLGATVGLPYLMLSTTGPLVQSWAARSGDSARVYRLFSLSNLASLVALISYPFLIEPWLTLQGQSSVWSAIYLGFVALCITSGVLLLRSAGMLRQHAANDAAYGAGTDAGPGAGHDAGDDAAMLRPANPVAAAGNATDSAASPTAAMQLLWVALAAMGSWQLLAVTNHLTQNIAAIPFLWLLPLVIYLFSFVLCFENDRWYRRSRFVVPVFALMFACAYGLADPKVGLNLKIALPLYCVGLFAACMFVHGELAALRPAPRHLTRFYLALSFGGALGGILVGLGAPKLLPAYYELGIGYVLLAMLAAIVFRPSRLLMAASLLLCVACAIFLGQQVAGDLKSSRVMERNFYGRLLTRDVGDGTIRVRRLTHGAILHGEEYLDGSNRNKPTTYYGLSSGIGRLMLATAANNARHVGVIGLGTGTLAAYGESGDRFRFYELDPAVIKVARTEFGYLQSTSAKVDLVLGDARLNLEREAPNGFDMLVVDAFSGDAIPVHLITREALRAYRRHMKPDGVIAFHVSNRYLSLAPVVQKLAEDQGMHAVLVSDAPQAPLLKTDWVLVSASEKLFAKPVIAEVASMPDIIPGLRVWTDDANNLFKILK